MNRNQRRYRISPKRDGNEDKAKLIKPKNDEIEEVLPPRFKRNQYKNDKANRSCYIKPNQRDVEQSVDSGVLDINFNDLVKQQYDFDPIIPGTINQLKELRKVLCESTPRVENCSQYENPLPRAQSYIGTTDGSKWQKMNNAEELEQLLSAENEGVPKSKIFDDKNIYISDVPHIKVIAEKFSKFTRNNVELRKLEEKIVCIEYNIFDQNDIEGSDNAQPIQKMRAYFSVKPATTGGENMVTVLPSTIKHEYQITDEDLKKLNEKEVEIIDGKIVENKPYLDDLKKVLKRKQMIYAKKQKSSLDLKSLYEMAKRDSPSLDEDFSDTNLLSKAELQEIKDLLTKTCASSIHGINRHTVKCDKDVKPKGQVNMNVISESIFAELVRNDAMIQSK